MRYLNYTPEVVTAHCGEIYQQYMCNVIGCSFKLDHYYITILV